MVAEEFNFFDQSEEMNEEKGKFLVTLKLFYHNLYDNQKEYQVIKFLPIKRIFLFSRTSYSTKASKFCFPSLLQF